MKKVLLIIIIVLNNLIVFAQDPPGRPKACINAPAGYILDELRLNIKQDCITLLNPTSNVVYTNGSVKKFIAPLTNVALYTPVDSASFDVNNLRNGITLDASNEYTETKGRGEWWSVLIGTNNNGQRIISCQYSKISPVLNPVWEISKCDVGANQVGVTFPDVQQNRDLSQVSILWADNKVDLHDNTGVGAFPKTFTHSITDVLTDKVVIQGSINDITLGRCVSDSKALKINRNDSTYIKSLVSYNNSKSATITFQDTRPGNSYKLALNTGTILPDTAISQSSFTINNLDSTKQYCFRVMSKSICNLDVPSKNDVCTINLTGTVIDTRSADLNWNLQDPTPTFAPIVTSAVSRLFRNGDILPLTAANDITYTDVVPNCSDLYTYNVEEKYIFPDPDNPINALTTTVTSADVILDFRKLYVPSIPNYFMYASYNKTQLDVIDLKINSAIIGGSNVTYEIYRADGGSSDFKQIGTSRDGSFSDPIANTALKYCYKYVVVEDCGIKSLPSDSICVINLTEPVINNLEWTSYDIPFGWYSPPLNEGSYVPQFSYDNGLTWREIGKTPFFQLAIDNIINNAPSTTVLFRIMLIQPLEINLHSGIQSFKIYSNTYVKEVVPLVMVPTIFSKKSESSENYTLKVYSKHINSGSLKIYDRWGEQIFQTDDILSGAWDGTISKSGKLAPSNTYIWVVTAEGKQGEVIQKKGTVVLIH